MAEILQKVLGAIIGIFRFHKKKIAFFLGSTLFCFLILFPYDDTSDWLTLQITKATRNNIYVQFDKLSFGLMPQLGLTLEDVIVESVFFPSLEVQSLGIAPNIISILTGRPGGTIKAWDLFSGEATISGAPSNELDTDGTEFGVEVELEQMNLKSLSKYLKKSKKIPFTLSGVTNLESKVYVDPQFKKQPQGDVKLVIDKLEIPSSSLPLNMGAAKMSLPLPAFSVSKVTLIGRIKDGSFTIKEGKIGDPKNELYGTITGDIVLNLAPGYRVAPGGYDLKINLNIKDNLQSQLSTILGMVDLYEGIGEKHKFKSLNGIRYSMRLRARNTQTPPRVTSN